MPANGVAPARALALFDIDGTLIRRAGPLHRVALEDAVRAVTGRQASTDHIPVVGMLDSDILMLMLERAGVGPRAARRALPAIMERAQVLYARRCPDLRRKVCPGARALLGRLLRRGVPAGLVTGNLARIGWKKMERAGLKPYFRFGAFAERAPDRAGLVRIAIREARERGWVARDALVSLIGDHPNDILAARASGVQSIAVATGLTSAEELAGHRPDLLFADLRSLRLAALLGDGK